MDESLFEEWMRNPYAPMYASSAPIKVERDFSGYISALLVLLDKGIIDRDEMRQALRDWGMTLKAVDGQDTEAGVKSLNRQEWFAHRLVHAVPSQWESILREYHENAGGKG